MAIKRPDIYEHNNPDLAIVDSDFVRGGGRVVADLTELYALYSKVDQLKENITKVYVTSEDKTYILVNITDVTLEIFNSTAWEIDSVGGGHVITNEIDTFTQRSNLKFTGNVTVSDDELSDSTIIDIAGGSGTETDPVFTQWLLDNPTSGENTGDQDLSNLAPLNHNHTGVYEAANTNIQSHISSTSNPHSVTKGQLGLGSVENYSAANMPISTATNNALLLKRDKTEIGDAHGFVNPPNSGNFTISNVGDQVTVSLLVNAGAYKINGTNYTNSGLSLLFTATPGQNFININSSGLFKDTGIDITNLTKIPCCTINFDGTNVTLADELHSATRNLIQHKKEHDTDGSRWVSGFTGSFLSTNTFSIATGEIRDEERYHAIETKTNLQIGYRGASSMIFDTPSTTFAKLSGGIALYDNNGTPTQITNNNYGVYYVYATNRKLPINSEIVSIMGQGVYTSVALAQAAAQPILLGMSIAEWKLLYRVIVRRTTGTPFSVIQADDLRLTTTGLAVSGGGLASVIASNVTYSSGGNISASNVQSALEELDAEKISTSEKGTANGLATLDAEGFVLSSQLKTVGSDVIEILEITPIIGDVTGMVTGDIAFNTDDNKLYTYSGTVWGSPTTPLSDKLYLCKFDNLTYKWNGTTLIATASPLPFAGVDKNKEGTSFIHVTTPSSTFGAFKYWLANTVFSSLTTGVQNIIGAINELKYGKQEAGTNNITPTASGGTYTILNNRINNLRSVWLMAGTHNINLATVSDNNIMNEQYVIFRTGGTVPTINFVQPYYNGLGTVAITNGSTSVTVAGTNASMIFKAGQVFIADGVTYTVASVTNSTTIVLSVAASVDFTGAYTYRPMLNYVYFPTVAINQLWHISFLYTNNSYAWVCDISVRVI